MFLFWGLINLNCFNHRLRCTYSVVKMKPLFKVQNKRKPRVNVEVFVLFSNSNIKTKICTRLNV